MRFQGAGRMSSGGCDGEVDGFQGSGPSLRVGGLWIGSLALNLMVEEDGDGKGCWSSM